jgi:hypothetical protein
MMRGLPREVRDKEDLSMLVSRKTDPPPQTEWRSMPVHDRFWSEPSSIAIRSLCLSLLTVAHVVSMRLFAGLTHDGSRLLGIGT